MQLLKLLHKTFQKELPFVHKVRLDCLMGAVRTLLCFNKLSLTALGRNYLNEATVRSNIRKMDRLLANKHLYTERLSFYKYLITKLIPKGSQPWIHVDWSCVCSTTGLYLLRATLSMPGRSIVIYEECHPKKKENNHCTHKAFLNRLKMLLPEKTKPIIITDAGFRCPWFAYILELKWHFVGRLRHKNMVFLESTKTSQLSSSFFKTASEIPKYLGAGLLTKANKVPVHLISYKGKEKGRHKLKTNKKYSKTSMTKRYSKANKEPWILVTSLAYSHYIAQKGVKIYKSRMQIEEAFRDTKCCRYGFGLNDSRSRSVDRINTLLLIAAIGAFASWLAGICIRQRNEASNYQARSAKHEGVLSYIFLGREALKKGLKIKQKQFLALWESLLDLTAMQIKINL